MKKWLTAMVTILLLVLALPTVEAQAAQQGEMVYRTQRFTSTSTRAADLDAYVDENAFRAYLTEQLATCPETVDISSFKIPIALDDDVVDTVFYRLPEAFHVASLETSSRGSYCTTIYPYYYDYADTDDEYKQMHREFMAGANTLLKGIQDDPQLTQLEKALLLHDRLVQWVAYDFENLSNNMNTMPDSDFNAYGVFSKRVAVCQGYTMAYMYLLDRIGVDNDYCDSEILCHAWNIVYIDGLAYHVDTTWDDPDILGHVLHDNFLRSTQGLISTGHEANDFDSSPVSTKYDSYYWQESEAAFCAVDGALYYIDAEDERIYRRDGDSAVEICTLDANWRYTGCYAGLAAAGDKLFFSTDKAIYQLDPTTGVKQAIYTPSLNSAKSEQIYGFNYEDDSLVILISDSPNLDYTGNERYIRYEYKVEDTTPDGWTEIDGQWYCYENGFKVVKDWRHDGIGWCYLGADGTKQKQAWIDDTYYVDADGYRVTGIYEINGTQYHFNDDGTLKPQYTVVFRNWDGTQLSARRYWEGQTPVAPGTPTRASDDTFTYTFAGWDQPVVAVNGNATYTAKFTAVPKETVKNGWIYESGKWYIYENGTMVKNAWRRDSKGWVYLGKDGAMLTNSWCMDSVGWCYVGADGYAVTNCWKKDSVGWCYLNANGSMTKNKWIKDGGKWYYLDANGYMVTNKWSKDSKGWVYCGKDGYMLVNSWCKDSKGWCYVGADGYAVTNCWKKDSHGWIYLDGSGSMSYSKWIRDSAGKWYYVDSTGYMVANRSVKIGTKTYNFNASGVCTNP